MASKVFMTGFPGFIAKRLVDRLLFKDPEASFTFLIEERLRPVADESLHALDERHSGFAARARLVVGDITRPLLGMSQEVHDAEAARATHVWHLAAIYNLAVSPSVAYRVNVVGTANVLDFCEACEGLQRLDYVSTCYVSGTRTGTVLERELDEGQSFKNHYESTKCWAEIEVRRRMPRLPVAIHRPGIVVGDSRTGETDKYDGPYFVMKLLAQVPTWVPMVHIGAGEAPVNLVPIDFTVDAMAEIWTRPQALGQTFQLVNPDPRTSREVMESILQAFGFAKPVFAVPPPLIEGALAIAPLRNLLKIPEEAVVYFNHSVRHDTTNLNALLEGTSLRCPDFTTIAPVLVNYLRQHPDKPFLDGRSF
jgi:thioester reductase-like protein